MTVTLELKPEIESLLATEAETRGIPLEKYVEKIVEERAVRSLSATDPRTPEEIEERRTQLMEIAKKWHALPTLDHRSPDEIIGYDEWGLPTR